MDNSPAKKPHIIFLFSDTGGGHRSAAEAIIEALELEFPRKFTCEMVDFFLNYSPPPLNLAAPVYPTFSRMDTLWKFSFDQSDDPDRMRVIYSMFWPYIRLFLYKLLREHPCDMFVSVHPLINIPLLRAMRRREICKPYLVVVTDLVSTHAAWFANEASKIIIPTQQAVRRAIRANVKPDQLKIIGLPVADRFCKPVGEKRGLREKLGWPQDKVVILLVGGGEGMGPLEEISREINSSNLDVALVAITGRNKKLKEKLESINWSIPVHIYGFVKDMPDLMRAADILLTKAGPGTISEALIAGLPIILYHRISGQEEGNVSYVIDEGAGVWAPDIADIIETLRYWLVNPSKRQEAVDNARRLARPNASREIAQEIASHLDMHNR
ncbi:MAG: glycosyltransferase [Anaerolineaceae bacterium]|nr:glycosyltransferase [Anaerolineaceae bacterium]